MKVGQIITQAETSRGMQPNSKYYQRFDNYLNKKGLKRLGPITKREGYHADDFVHRNYTLMLTAFAVRVPRIINPLHKKHKLPV